jgi:MFS family permease
MLTRGQEFKRAWMVLLAAAIGAGTGEAVIAAYSMGALVEPLAREFGWSRAQITAAPIFTSLGVLLVGAPVGLLADRFGARKVALISQALLVAALAAMSLIGHQIWTFYLAYFLLPVFGAGTLPITWSRAVNAWFVSGRGLALGFSLMGTGVVGALLPSYVTFMAARYGVQGAYLGLAALPLVISMPLTLLLFREPCDSKADVNAAPAPDATGDTVSQAMRSWRFWQMSLAFLLATVAVSAVLVHSLSLLLDRGIPKAEAAALAGLFGVSITAGRLVSGYLLDLFPAPRVAFFVFILPAAACALLAVAGDNLLLCGLAIALVGLAGGSEHDLAAYLTGQFYGPLHFGAIYGVIYTIYGIGGGVGPLLVGQLRDITGTYQPALYAGVALFAMAAVLCGTLRGSVHQGQAALAH